MQTLRRPMKIERFGEHREVAKLAKVHDIF